MTWYRLLKHICTVDDVVKFAYKMGNSVMSSNFTLTLYSVLYTVKGVGSNNAGFLVYQANHIEHSIDKHGVDKECR